MANREVKALSFVGQFRARRYRRGGGISNLDWPRDSASGVSVALAAQPDRVPQLCARFARRMRFALDLPASDEQYRLAPRTRRRRWRRAARNEFPNGAEQTAGALDEE